MSAALAIFEALCTVGNALEALRDMYVPESDQWLWHAEVLAILDQAVDTLVHSAGLGGADDA
jgi:hypothetical protein